MENNDAWYYNHKCLVEGLLWKETPPLAATSLGSDGNDKCSLCSVEDRRGEGNYGTVGLGVSEKKRETVFCAECLFVSTGKICINFN